MTQVRNKKLNIVTNPMVFLALGFLNVIFLFFYYYLIDHIGTLTPGNRELLNNFGKIYGIIAVVSIIHSFLLKKTTTKDSKKHNSNLYKIISIILLIIFTIGLIILIGYIYQAYSFYEYSSYLKRNNLLPMPGA